MRSILQITYREWKRIFSLPVHYRVLIIMPPLLFFFYAYIYESQHAENLPMAVWDEDHSSISRTFTFMLEQAGAIHITRSVASEAELRDLVQKGEVLGGVHFPKKMESDIYSKHPVYVTLYTNTAALVPAKLIYKDAAQVIITAGSGVILQKLVKTGMNKNKAMALVQPVRLQSYPLYNPDYNYQQYLAPGLITVAMQMIIIMVAVLVLNYENDTRTMRELFVLSHGSASNVIAGKTLAHLSVSWLNFILIAGVIYPMFNLTHAGATGKFFILYTLLTLACLGIGMMISGITKDIMLASDVGLFYTSPAFVFSGYTFPRWAMPWYDQYYANIMPYTAFLDGYIKVYSMNIDLKYAQPEIMRLLWFIVITFPVAVVFFQRQMQKNI
ncbi:ABC transporter permease [Danxiaibacter flavus]|uniref:ABC transporter permease n=1 Tax=Danxiaibacter flavus TaxID=3049108 RepID=A0ABV3Z7U9_9BACT|nr:ABC transporter permease [Chitinophagaceae bacterium DXS]